MRVAFRDMPEVVWMLRHPLQAARDLFRELLDLFERGWRGYARTDVWNLHSYLAIWLPSALRQMRDGCSYPSDLTSDEWREKLTLMIRGFEDAHRLIDGKWGQWESARKKRKEVYLHSKLGMQEFIDRFYDLWD